MPAARSSASRQAWVSAASADSVRPMLVECGVWRPRMWSAGWGCFLRGVGDAGDAAERAWGLGARVLRDSCSGERVGVRFFFSRAARLVARALRFLGSTAPVVGVTRGARPFLGRVEAW